MNVTDFVEVNDIGNGQSFLTFYREDGSKVETPAMDIWRANKVAEAIEEALEGWEGWTR